MSTEYPKPIHDYKDESKYKNHGNNLSAWAWEFLRRNAEYQQACDEQVIAEEALRTKEGELTSDIVDSLHDSDGPMVRFGVFDFFSYLLDYEDQPDCIFVPRGADPVKRVGPWQLQYGAPADDPFLLDLAEQSRLVVFAFDVSHTANAVAAQLTALKVEIEEIKDRIDQAAEGVKLPQKPDLRTATQQLRYLDSMAAGEKDLEFMKSLGLTPGKNRTSFNRTCEQAIRYRDIDYRLLAYKSEHFAKEARPPTNDQSRLDALNSRSDSYHEKSQLNKTK